MAKKTNKLPVGKMSAPVPVKIVHEGATAYKPSKSEMDERRKYQAEDALRAIERAEEYKRDKSLMNDVKKLAANRMASLKKIC